MKKMLICSPHFIRPYLEFTFNDLNRTLRWGLGDSLWLFTIYKQTQGLLQIARWAKSMLRVRWKFWVVRQCQKISKLQYLLKVEKFEKVLFFIIFEKWDRLFKFTSLFKNSFQIFWWIVTQKTRSENY